MAASPSAAAGSTISRATLPGRVVVIEFPDAAAARAWYDDPDYVAIRGLRQEVSDIDLVIVEGASRPVDGGRGAQPRKPGLPPNAPSRMSSPQCGQVVVAAQSR